MKRIEFLKIIGVIICNNFNPVALKSRDSNKLKFNSLLNQVGFNHIPNK